ncbi:hypothetical protein V8C86DRAFT_1793683 [Haematococcus lacustris]
MALATRNALGRSPGCHVRPANRSLVARRTVCKAIELDWSDPDTLLGAAGLVLGVAMGLGAPIWYINRTERDEKRLEELRAMNRANYEATGEYMKDEEIAAVRKPRWTDRREWADDD